MLYDYYYNTKVVYMINVIQLMCTGLNTRQMCFEYQMVDRLKHACCACSISLLYYIRLMDLSPTVSHSHL